MMTSFTAYRRHRRLIGWIGWSLCAVLTACTLACVVAAVVASDPRYLALAALLAVFALSLGVSTYLQVRAHIAVSEGGVSVVNGFATYQIPWGAVDAVELELSGGGDVSYLYHLVFTTPDRVIAAAAPVGLAAPMSRMAALRDQILDYRRQELAADAHPATAVTITGPAARFRKLRPVGGWSPRDDSRGRAENDAAASTPPATRQDLVWSTLRSVAFGGSAALLGAAAYAALVVPAGHDADLASAAVATIVGLSVGATGAPLRRLWLRSISVVLTLLSLLLAEYVVARHLAGLTQAPLVMSTREIATLIHDDIAANHSILWLWGIALLFAWLLAGSGEYRIGAMLRPGDDAETTRRPWRWFIARRHWWAATAAFATGLATLVVLAGVHAGQGAPDRASAVERDSSGQILTDAKVPFPDVKVGDCYDDRSNQLLDAIPEVPCRQPHDAEVFYIFAMSAGKYPGDDAVLASVDATCPDRLLDYVGDTSVSLYLYGGFPPNQASWDTGDRSIICTLIRSDHNKLNRTTRAQR